MFDNNHDKTFLKIQNLAKPSDKEPSKLLCCDVHSLLPSIISALNLAKAFTFPVNHNIQKFLQNIP